MKKLCFFFISYLLINNVTYADKLGTISNNLANLVSIQTNIQSLQNRILDSQLNIQVIMKQVDANMTGHSGWGNYQFQDYQSYGDNAKDWSSVLRMAEKGQGSEALGQLIGNLANQFPLDSKTFNTGVTDVNAQRYYALKSQTVLAARAASQLDYNKIQDQIAYQQMLQQQIEKTKDIKAALDLSNRIHIEGNLINLEILRQATLANQQHAITEQATINTALSNARFLTRRN